MRKSLQVKGVAKVEMDYDKKLFTLTVDFKARIKPSDIEKAVTKRFKVSKILVEGLVGSVKKDGDQVTFTSSRSKLKYVLEEAKDGKVLKELREKLGDKKRFRLSGEAKEIKRTEKNTGKKKSVLTLVITGAKEIKPERK